MRRPDDQDLRKVLSEALGASDVPELPWQRIAAQLPGRNRDRPIRWWAISAAVLLLPLAVAWGSRQGELITPAHLRQIRVVGSVPLPPQCRVTFSISGPTLLKPLGSVTLAQPSLPPQNVGSASGSSFPAGCGQTIKLTEHPVRPTQDVFTGWKISPRPGVVEPVAGRPRSIWLTPRGDVVVYVMYLPADEASSPNPTWGGAGAQ